MNASALLTRQGWLGDGHALDRAGRGVKKPILVSRKSDTLGVGKKKVDVHADQWWARAFDEGLKGLNPGSNSNVNTVSQDVKSTKISELDLLANGGKKWLGLYSGFVRGEGLEGTIGREVVHGIGGETGSKNKVSRTEEQQKKKKRRRDCEDASEVPLVPVSDKNAETVGKEIEKRRKHKKKKNKTDASLNTRPDLEETVVTKIEIISSTIAQPKVKEETKKARSKVSHEGQSELDGQSRKGKKRKHKKSSLSAG